MNVETSSHKVPVILVGFKSNLNFPNTFSKKAQISSFIKISPMGAKLLHVDEYDRANSHFLQFLKHV
jgi:hypothetical protein